MHDLSTVLRGWCSALFSPFLCRSRPPNNIAVPLINSSYSEEKYTGSENCRGEMSWGKYWRKILEKMKFEKILILLLCKICSDDCTDFFVSSHRFYFFVGTSTIPRKVSWSSCFISRTPASNNRAKTFPCAEDKHYVFTPPVKSMLIIALRRTHHWPL